MKKAIVTGITGQDGAYLTQLLLEKNYTVYGTYRRTSSVNFWRLNELNLLTHPNLHLIEYDLIDPGASLSIVKKYEPVEIYNLAAQSFVGVSFEQPNATSQITGMGALNLLEAIRLINPKIKYYQASTSEMFGKVQSIPQSENTAFYPRSPYGIAKLFAHWMTINYRESYGIFGATGILFNHESPLRGKEFVTRKITDNVAQIKLGLSDSFELGNLDAKRDWGFAKEYVEGMWRILQAEEPDNFVLATNRSETIRDFVSIVPQHADPRGVFVEMLKTPDAGQFSYFTAHPGITRGGHYHHSKTEKFLVIKGKARFKFRHVETGQVHQLFTSGDLPEIVETVPGWTHDITNTGTTEMIVMLWANEVFDRARPDTFACPV